jgi:hypothetical protein
MVRQFRLAAHHHALGSGARSALGGATSDQFPLELGEAAEHRQHQHASAPVPPAGHILAEMLPLADRTVDLKCAFASPVMGRRQDGHDRSMHRLVGAAQLYLGAAFDLEILPLRT